MLDTGAGFKPVKPGTPVTAGDKILVGRNSSVSLRYSDTCVESLKTRGVTSVSSTGCLDQAAAAGAVGAAGAGAAAAGAAGAGAALGIGTAGLVAVGVIGTAAVGTIVAVATSSDNGTSPAPVSPASGTSSEQ